MSAEPSYAEVIGDPVDQSKSPLIHRHWLQQLSLERDYLRSRVAPGALGSFLEERRADSRWRGCNVTIPHKQTIVALVDVLDEQARSIGAVNCIVPGERGLGGYNTDIDGIAAVLDEVDLAGRTAVMIGAGGAARAAAVYLARRDVGKLVILVRDPKKAEVFARLMPRTTVEMRQMSEAEGVGRPAVVVNASPLGMAGQPPFSAGLLEILGGAAPSALFFDMVYEPVETDFLKAGHAGGACIADGLTMLIAQAARAFELFFKVPPPPPDRALRDLLAT
jgi:shikimate dehydrogenase